MILTIILVGFSLILANIALYFFMKRQLLASIRSFVAPRGENESEFAELIGLITDQGAAKTAQSLKSVFMGQNSVAAKNAGRLETAVTTDLVSQQAPLLGMGMTMFPQLQKLITKNPGALQMLASFMKSQGRPSGDNELAQVAGNGQDAPSRDVFQL